MPSLPRRKSRRKKRTTLRSRKRILRTRRSHGSARGPSDSYAHNENVYAVLGHANSDTMNALEGLIPLDDYQGHDLNTVSMLQSGIGELSYEIQKDYAEITQEGLPEDYVQYKELFIRKRLYLLDRLVASFYGIINNQNDPEFKADARRSISLVQEDMEQMTPIRNAFRRR